MSALPNEFQEEYDELKETTNCSIRRLLQFVVPFSFESHAGRVRYKRRTDSRRCR